MNFSFTGIESLWLGLLIKTSCFLSDLYDLHQKNRNSSECSQQSSKDETYTILERVVTKNPYPVDTRSTWNAFLDCKSSSQTELAKALPKDWNKFITEGSHALTSSVRDLTCSKSHPRKRVAEMSNWYIYHFFIGPVHISFPWTLYPVINKKVPMKILQSIQHTNQNKI